MNPRVRWLLVVLVLGLVAGWLAAQWLPEPTGTVVLLVSSAAVLGLIPLGRLGRRRVASRETRGGPHSD